MSLLLGPLGIQIKSTDLVLNTPQNAIPPVVVEPRGTDYESPAPIPAKQTYVLACETGAYVYAGNDATLTYHSGAVATNYTLTCAVGAYSYSGLPATLTVARNLQLATGAYAYTGNAATLTYVPGAVTVNYTLTCETGAYLYQGNDTTFVKTGASTGHIGGDDAPGGWKKAKKRKKQDQYAEATIARKQALIAAYKGLLEPETPEVIAIEAKTVVQSEKPESLDLVKVQKLLEMWQAEIDRREEQDDEEALLMLL